jgi:GNAT superfamily N-acetyltransferase
MDLTVRAVTPELWPALESLFGRAGASNGCWCMYWRLGPGYRRRPEENRAALQAITEQGPTPGLLAFEGDKAVGWCQLTPRAALPYLDQMWPGLAATEQPIWSLSCFFVLRGYRGRGVAAALIGAAVDSAWRARAVAIEAYPVDTGAARRTHNLFTGTLTAFTRAGFSVVTRGPYGRVLVRYEFD